MRTNLYKSFIAKTGGNSDLWLPLWMHLQDTSGIMERLIDEYISASFATACEFNDIETLKKTSVFLAYVHDIGKATVLFQDKIGKKLPDRRQKLEHYGIIFPGSYNDNETKITPHALAGEEILLLLGCPKGISAIVGSHHGVPADVTQVNDQDLTQPYGDIVGCKNYYGEKEKEMDINKEILKKAWENIFDNALSYAGFKSVKDIPNPSRSVQMLLTGLLIMADWIASNTEYLPLISIDMECPELMDYPQRVDYAWEKLEFTEIWKSERNTYNDDEFYNSFNFYPNSIQREVLDIIQNSKKPGLFILEAPMGCGKTEVALASTELLAKQCNKKGLFFGLPTQATANGLFPRIQDWAENQSEEFYHSIQLKHGNADLNEQFQAIQRGIPDEGTDSGLIVHSWFCNSKKACLADFVVATVDQLLMMALKRRHVMLLHLGLSEKVVVIDEVHAYDAYMNQYLERALQWLGAYNTPVILLSATLPAERRMSLIRAYLGLKRIDERFEKEKSYPLLTWTDDAEIKQEPLSYDGEHRYINIQKCTKKEIMPKLQTVVEQGGCVGIIVNTVKNAQTLAKQVREEITADVLLYHAQYLLPDRAKKEQELLERIGKNSTYSQRKGLVVVGTQVLEQSLDVDFDLLITDICPMDLLLQRIGRLHRHNRPDRPKAVNEPLCMVMCDETEVKSSSSCKIYSEWLLHQTLKELPQAIKLPDDISSLVQKVYNAYDESEEYKEYKKNENKSESKAGFRIREPKTKRNRNDDSIHDLLEYSNEASTDIQAEASVRDGDPSIEVLVMQKKKDGNIYFLPWQYNGKKIVELNDEICYNIAEQRLRLPSVFCKTRKNNEQVWRIDKVIRELEEQCRHDISEWNNFYLLKGQLVLFFDEDLHAELLDYQLSYSLEEGLQYEKKEDVDGG